MAASFEQAVSAFSAGDLKSAEASVEALLKREPENPRALNLLGAIKARHGEYSDAEALVTRATGADPSYAQAFNNLGAIYLEQQRYADAQKQFEKAVGIKADYAVALDNLAAALLGQEKHHEARLKCEAALKIDPDFAKAYLTLGNVYLALEEDYLAEAAFDRAVALEPDNPDAAVQYAKTLYKAGDAVTALEVFEKIRERDPNRKDLVPDYWDTLLYLGETKRAETNSAAFISKNSTDPAAQFHYANLLGKLGRFEESTKILDDLLADDTLPDPLKYRTLFHRANHGKIKPDEPVIAVLENALAESKGSDPREKSLYFAAGKLFSDLEDYDKAFHFYEKANALSEKKYDKEDTESYYDSLIAFYDEARWQELRRLSEQVARPIFIVGMPRSGTTLTEQIIAKHPDVHGAGELRAVGRLQQTAMNPLIVNEKQGRIESRERMAATLNGCAETYLEYAYRHARGKPRTVDKMPQNFVHLGLITTMFPHARIVHSLRDPIDTCLSCFFQNFSEKLSFSFDLESLGHYYQQYRRLMDHWQDLMGDDLFTLRYEELVEDPKTKSAEVADYCGLSWSDEILESENRDKAILTASVWQARQGVYKTSRKRWKKYEKHLGPLIEALGPYAEESFKD